MMGFCSFNRAIFKEIRQQATVIKGKVEFGIVLVGSAEFQFKIKSESSRKIKLIMNKEFLASTSVFAEMANNSVDIQKIISEFIINTYILNKTFTQDSTQIKSELVSHFDIDVPEAVIRSLLKRLKKDNVLDYIDGQFIINSEHRLAREYINKEVNEKREIQNKIFDELSAYVRIQTGPLNNEERKKLEGVFIEYLFDNTISDEYATLISGYIVKNQNSPEFTKELNLIREGATILKGIYYTTDFNDENIWRNKLTIYLDTEHLLSLSGLNGVTFKLMLMDFFNLVRDINTKVQKKTGKLIYLKFTKNVKSEIEKLFYVAGLIVKGKATLLPGKTAIKNIVDGCDSSSDITRKTAEFFTELKSLGIFEADEIDLLEHPEYNIVDQHSLTKYSDEKSPDEIHKILEEFTFINNLRRGRNNMGFENISHILMTGDRVTRLMSYDNDLKMSDSGFSFATDVYYVTQRLWFKLNKGLGFTANLPATLNIVNKARVIISSQINSSVRSRYNKLEKEIAAGARTPDEVKEYYLRLRSNTFTPENINENNIAEHINFIYAQDDVEKFLRDRSAEKSALKERDKKVKELNKKNEINSVQTEQLRLAFVAASKKSANKLFNVYKFIAILIISLIVLLIAFIGYFLRQETDSNLSFVAFIISGISLLLGLFSWKKIIHYLRKKAFNNHENLISGKEQYPIKTESKN